MQTKAFDKIHQKVQQLYLKSVHMKHSQGITLELEQLWDEREHLEVGIIFLE